MGVTYIEGHVKGLMGKQENVKFLLDSGVTYSVLPKAVWEASELKPKRELSFILADGTTVERWGSEVLIAFPEGEAHTPADVGRRR